MRTFAEIMLEIIRSIVLIDTVGILVRPVRRIPVIKYIFRETASLYGYLILAEMVCRVLAYDSVPLTTLGIDALSVVMWMLFPWKDDDDDDRWKRRLESARERVAEAAGRLVVVPAKG